MEIIGRGLTRIKVRGVNLAHIYWGNWSRPKQLHVSTQVAVILYQPLVWIFCNIKSWSSYCSKYIPGRQRSRNKCCQAWCTLPLNAYVNNCAIFTTNLMKTCTYRAAKFLDALTKRGDEIYRQGSFDDKKPPPCCDTSWAIQATRNTSRD